MPSTTSPRVAIIGGCGHVGLPLGIAFAAKGHKVTLVDTDPFRVGAVREGRMPFHERGADEQLPALVKGGAIVVQPDLSTLGEHEVVIVTIGTPVDEFLDPDVRSFDRSIRNVLDAMRAGQLLVLRSTVFPGVTDRLARKLAERSVAVDLAYCPERIAQGYALEELEKLPQLVGGASPEATRRASALFASLGARIIETQPVEAELAKLFANSFRYINFAISNQFYMIAEKFGADYRRIYQAVTADYPRLKGLAMPGFAGGPCLLKDTMQLAAFNHSTCALGQAAMIVNEGLPSFIIERLAATQDLKSATVGILGMAFKGNCDDPRSSLTYKIRKILTLMCKRVVCTDPHIQDESFLSLERTLAESDVLIVGACHDEYRALRIEKPVVDVFYFLNQSKERGIQ